MRSYTTVLALLFAGCTSQVSLTVSSDPPGAEIIQSGQVLGYTPTILYYPTSVFEQANGGCGTTLPLTVKWASGAVSTLPVTLCKSIGIYQQYTFERPNVPGLETDIYMGDAVLQQRQLAEHQQTLEALAVYEALSNDSGVYSTPTSGYGDSLPGFGICNCKGYAGPGGPCYDGPGGPAYSGPGGSAYDGPGGPCYAGPGGAMYDGPGGPAYGGPGGPMYDGPGGSAYDGPGGPAYDGPGGPCYEGPGGPCYDGPGGTGVNCPAVCE